MSYVRWSSDEGHSDVYVYEDVDGGWQTLIGDRKRSYQEVHGSYQEEDLDGSIEWYKDHDPRFAGVRFNHSSPKECALNLLVLREAGLHVPHYAINELFEEQSELDKSDNK